MLSKEQAERLLAEHRVKDPDAAELARIECLPPSLRTIALDLAGRSAKRGRERSYAAICERREQALVTAAALSVRDRLRVWEALFPRLAPHIDAALELLLRGPYQSSYAYCRAFRAPGERALVRDKCSDWLASMIAVDRDYGQSVAWYAAWATYADTWRHPFGTLLAAVIDSGGPAGDEVFDILTAIARGEHEIGVMGNHVIGGLQMASRPDGWQVLEQLLLAAQRQEGLRQQIIENADLAHPGAFERILQLIVDRDLARFSSTVRAADVWFATRWAAPSAREVNQAINAVLGFLRDAGAAERAVRGGRGVEAYLALWSMAYRDAVRAVTVAAPLVRDSDPERRFAAVWLLGQTCLNTGAEGARPALQDSDPRVAWGAFLSIMPFPVLSAFDDLERYIVRLPKKPQPLQPVLWPWLQLKPDRAMVAREMVKHLGKRDPARLMPYIGMMDSVLRGDPIRALAPRKKEPAIRSFLLQMVGDPSPTARNAALDALDRERLSGDEVRQLEDLLTRKAADMRQGILILLREQDRRTAQASADRLLAAPHALQRHAGEELAKALGGKPAADGQSGSDQSARGMGGLRKLAHALFGKAAEQIPPPEATPAPVGVGGPTIEAARAEMEADSLKPAPGMDPLGLYERSACTPPAQPRVVPGVLLETEAANRALLALGELVHEHRETPVRLRTWDGSECVVPLTAEEALLPAPDAKLDLHDDLARLPLADLWLRWSRERPMDLRDADGFDLLRMASYHSRRMVRREEHLSVTVGGRGVPIPQWRSVQTLLPWMLRAEQIDGAARFLLDTMETSFAQLGEHTHAKGLSDEPWTRSDHEYSQWQMRWYDVAMLHLGLWPDAWAADHYRRLWPLLRWREQHGPDTARVAPDWSVVAAAYRAGGATRADVIARLTGTKARSPSYQGRGDLCAVTRRASLRELERDPELLQIVKDVCARILDLEIERGDLATPATRLVGDVRNAGGMDVLLRVLTVADPQAFVRRDYSWSYGGGAASRAESHSRIVYATRPRIEDTPGSFAEAVRGARVPERRLLDLAVLAPQWAAHVEAALEWPGLDEAVWWLSAHTKEPEWGHGEEREQWAADVAERTALSSQDLMDGAVDVDWFRRAYGLLGDARWTSLDKSAKYTASGAGHKRAQLFADAMRGRVPAESLRERIGGKRHQDSVRALGLVPLPEGESRNADVLDRYLFLQEFARQSREFGSMRQASEKLAVSIAMQNLARTAGYPDPVRLEWAMEREAVADLAAGPINATDGTVEVELSIDPFGRPRLLASKGGKSLASVPATAKKQPDVAAVVEREKAIRKQASRMRKSLEEAMCRGDEFTGTELRDLMTHPILAPMLRSLVFVGECIRGYPTDGAAALEDHRGEVVALPGEVAVRLAHPCDLLKEGDWHLWQRDCFLRERVQPFKQVFRELYVLTEAEREERTQSPRYAGHQVNPRQALALLGQRGWVNHPEEGPSRTFHSIGIVARLDCEGTFWTPAEVEAPTLNAVMFTRRGEYERLPLDAISPVVFSEVMRDVDLVVSIAHMGGVDPEASASTMEMRASVITETCRLLGLDNVAIDGSFARIDGTLTRYSVHLGSAMVHQTSGAAIVIVAVHGQHRGRLFLPFVDDDPRTAEVVSKVLMLARDQDIRDTAILSQIVRG